MSELFKWRKIDFIKTLLGTFLFAFAINVFIVPKGLYKTSL